MFWERGEGGRVETGVLPPSYISLSHGAEVWRPIRRGRGDTSGDFPAPFLCFVSVPFSVRLFLCHIHAWNPPNRNLWSTALRPFFGHPLLVTSFVFGMVILQGHRHSEHEGPSLDLSTLMRSLVRFFFLSSFLPFFFSSFFGCFCFYPSFPWTEVFLLFPAPPTSPDPW